MKLNGTTSGYVHFGSDQLEGEDSTMEREPLVGYDMLAPIIRMPHPVAYEKWQRYIAALESTDRLTKLKKAIRHDLKILEKESAQLRRDLLDSTPRPSRQPGKCEVVKLPEGANAR